MIYVMSDLHGSHDLYFKMLEEINLQQEDTLYILGDVIDRGIGSIEILRDMIKRKNVIPLMGNHEYDAIPLLRKILFPTWRDFVGKQGDVFYSEEYRIWRYNGGDPTLALFRSISKQEAAELIDYMADFLPYAEVQMGEKKFILVHAGLGNFSEDKPLDDYDLWDLTHVRPDFYSQYYKDENTFVVFGHTPTPMITQKTEIFHGANNICIDCAAVFDGGRLACLRLDDMKEFYVE